MAIFIQRILVTSERRFEYDTIEYCLDGHGITALEMAHRNDTCPSYLFGIVWMESVSC
jgi:hypothetical protein